MAKTLRLGLGPGESEAITLASELSAARLILDDKKARRIAQQLGLPVTGTLAVLLRAKQQGFIPNVRDVLDDLAVAEFRVSDALIQDTLRQAGEYRGSADRSRLLGVLIAEGRLTIARTTRAARRQRLDTPVISTGGQGNCGQGNPAFGYSLARNSLAQFKPWSDRFA